jgi:hypothetical protein
MLSSDEDEEEQGDEMDEDEDEEEKGDEMEEEDKGDEEQDRSDNDDKSNSSKEQDWSDSSKEQDERDSSKEQDESDAQETVPLPKEGDGVYVLFATRQIEDGAQRRRDKRGCGAMVRSKQWMEVLSHQRPTSLTPRTDARTRSPWPARHTCSLPVIARTTP